MDIGGPPGLSDHNFDNHPYGSYHFGVIGPGFLNQIPTLAASRVEACGHNSHLVQLLVYTVPVDVVVLQAHPGISITWVRRMFEACGGNYGWIAA